MNKLFSYLFLLVILLLLWIYKWHYLPLPFFWDEAWSYAPAVYSMYTHHLSLLPGELQADLSRGHPLWYYFMNAGMARLFGFTPVVMHSFALVLSSLFLMTCFWVMKTFTNELFAGMGVALIAVQEIFIVQSSFMLPEVFLALLTILTLFAFIQNKKLLYLLASTLLVLTKETGLVIILAVLFTWLLFNAILLLFKKKTESPASHLILKKVGVDLLVWSIPLWAAFLFYVIQKEREGWFFYPFHLEILTLDAHTILQKLAFIGDYVFLQPGRCILALMVAAMMILLFLKVAKRGYSLPGQWKRLALHLFIVFSFYALFSMLNFLMIRYLFLLIVIFIFYTIIVCYELYKKQGWTFLPWLLCIPLALSLRHDFTSDPSWIDDVSMNYTDEVKVHQEAVAFMEGDQAQSQKVFTHMLMKYNLTHPELFYLHGEPFKQVETISSTPPAAAYYIFSNIELEKSNFISIKSDSSYHLIKRFEKGKAWCVVYKR